MSETRRTAAPRKRPQAGPLQVPVHGEAAVSAAMDVGQDDALESQRRRLLADFEGALREQPGMDPEGLEFMLGHLPGSLNVPLDELEARLSELDAEQEIVAYCRGAYCVLSFDAVARLRALGFNARRLEDGYPEWRAAGLPWREEVVKLTPKPQLLELVRRSRELAVAASTED